jgi:hypothetical protein
LIKAAFVVWGYMGFCGVEETRAQQLFTNRSANNGPSIEKTISVVCKEVQGIALGIISGLKYVGHKTYTICADLKIFILDKFVDLGTCFMLILYTIVPFVAVANEVGFSLLLLLFTPSFCLVIFFCWLIVVKEPAWEAERELCEKELQKQAYQSFVNNDLMPGRYKIERAAEIERQKIKESFESKRLGIHWNETMESYVGPFYQIQKQFDKNIKELDVWSFE